MLCDVPDCLRGNKTMADYIERQAAVSRFEQLKEQADTLRDKLYLDGVLAVIDALPAANVRDDVQGKWEPGNPICPVCGENKFKGLDADIWADWQPRFCPNCGARMAGGGER